jgi:outer membrane receptor protein involved in Fe transport
MNNWKRLCLNVAAGMLCATTAFAQGVQTGTLQGTAADAQGGVLPGVVITASSSALQGARTATTDENGVYLLRGLPAGAYTVKFELQGFSTVEQQATVNVGAPTQVNATLAVGGQAETINVTANPVEAAVTSTATTANFKYEEIQSLPAGRNPQAIASLAPGLTTNTPNAGQVTISGGFAYDNVFLVDGVDVNDNLFGTANNLFIEDAIEETQVLTSGISAEYGRFSGGVINVVTKSGGDQFSGTYRLNLANDKWQERTPFEVSRSIQKADKINPVHEGTFGGPILKSKLWFFAAGRYLSTENQVTLTGTGLPFLTTNEEKRGQVKGTYTLANNHTFQGTWTSVRRDAARTSLSFTGDPRGVENPSFPNDGYIANYRGVLSDKLLADVRFSRKEFGFRNSGGNGQTLADSPFINLSTPTVHYNAPYFDATDPENRNNYQAAGSLAYALSTAGAGTHDIKGGFEVFNSSRTGGNSQSPTNYVYNTDYLGTIPNPTLDGQGRFIPVFVPGESILEQYIPTRGAQVDTRTLSFYVQDQWRLGRHWTFDVGARYEKVDGDATGGIVTVDSSAFVPRLATSYDILGDGRFVAQATYAHYAGKYSESQFASNTTVGNPTYIVYVYDGPEGQGLDFAPGLNPANYSVIDGEFPLANVFVGDGLSSPVTREFTASLGAAIGRGYLKGTFVDRDVNNVVDDFITLSNGVTTVEQDGIDFGTFTNIVYDNTDVPERRYQALQFQGRYPLFDRLTLYGNYTLQIKNDGNFEGEGANTPGAPSLFGDYPEIYSETRNFPTGRLNDFQRHKVRAWGTYTQRLGVFGDVDFSLLYRYDSPLTYSLSSGSVPLTSIQRQLGAAYPNLPNNQTLFYSGRGSEFFDAAHLWDLGIQFEVPVFRSLRPYAKLDVFNLFNNDKLIGWNTTVSPDNNGPRDSLGLPLNYIQGANFGQATGNGSYAGAVGNVSGARRIAVAVGFRF